jgi:hypothetical protein
MKIIIEKQTRKMMKRLKSDNGFAFFSSEIGEFFYEKRYYRHMKVRYTPQQNKVDIMMNKTLLKRARSNRAKPEKPSQTGLNQFLKKPNRKKTD